jgi:hypothetical protein
MPPSNAFHCAITGAMIGMLLALTHLLKSATRNYTAIGINSLLLIGTIGIDQGFRGWLTLGIVATTVYFGCLSADQFLLF